MKLFHIRLINGDEIISESEASSDQDRYLLVNPLEINNVVDGDTGITAIILQEYSPFNIMGVKIEINKAHVMSLSKVEGEMINYYKASLEFAVLFGNNEKESKIKAATDHLTNYMQCQLKQDSSPEEIEDPFDEDFIELDEDDLDEETLEAITSSNTTIH